MEKRTNLSLLHHAKQFSLGHFSFKKIYFLVTKSHSGLELCSQAMPNQNSVKRPRARRFWSPQSNKKTNLMVKFSYIIPMFRDSEKK